MQQCIYSIHGVNSDVHRYVRLHTFTHSALLQTHPPTKYKFPHTAAMQVTCCTWLYREEKKGSLKFKGWV